MNERKPEHLKLATPSLKTALRGARFESAEQSEAVHDLRQTELTRLELLAEAIRPVLDQAPEDVDLFDLGVAHGERPRLFLDMISFVDLGHDRRTYRFFQDTRHGRVLIAENANKDRIVSAITNYVARRLVEREQALASDWSSAPDKSIVLKANLRARQLEEGVRGGEATTPEPPRRRVSAALGDVLGFLLMTVGALALIAIAAMGLAIAWSDWGRALWTSHFGAPPF